MPTQIEKLEAFAGRLLDAMILLRSRYALLDPLLFEEETVKWHSAGPRARGFFVLRQSLFLSCVQEVAKLSLDSDTRTPSVKSIIASLQDKAVRSELRERFAVWRIPMAEDEHDREVIVALRRMELREESDRQANFEELLGELEQGWSALQSSAALRAMATVRDKVSAHTEIRYVADKYQPVDIGSLGMVWGDLRATITGLQRLVELIGLVVRNAPFAWDMLDRDLAFSADAFWARPQ
jgi:hypothetical protein